MLIAYLDEFGHVGPYVSRDHAKYKDHPVFGYAGYIIPAQHARYFGAEFLRVKRTLFKTEIEQDSSPPSGSAKARSTSALAALPNGPSRSVPSQD
ncbi:DUF3800 domain-containing protein [Paenarthrobacter sp. NPDC089675]|uniref:DUF3800 domain-containing protein n=1 Tax=Paenarthrobacter sp. NPDC089675 TaxID=3364376 RepID=UPI003816E3A9